jgi:hypothetical protein
VKAESYQQLKGLILLMIGCHIMLRGHWCHIIALSVHAATEDEIHFVKDSFCEEWNVCSINFLNVLLNILLGDFSAKVGRKDIFKPTIGNESLHKIGINNGVKLVHFASSNNLRVKSTMFPHRKIHKYTWTSPDGKTHNPVDHILVDWRRHRTILDVRSYRAVDCDTDHYLVVAKFRERLTVNKQRPNRFHMERFNLKKLNEVEGKEQYRVEVSNRFAAFEDLEAEVEINSASETVRENIKMSAKESLGYY